MTKSEKIKLLQTLDERELREKVLVPLLTKMGFIDPIIYHHPGEKGKDIICKEIDLKFSKINYISVIVKNGNVTGSSSGSNSYFALINQVKQSFNEPYKHIYELKEVNIDQCIIILSGRFLSTSLDSIYGTLKAERLEKAIRETIDIDRLPDLIDNYFHEFWIEFDNEKEELTKQRNNLLNNISKLLNIIIQNPIEQEKALKIVSNSDAKLKVMPFSEINKYIARLIYNEINITEIDEYYSDIDITNYWGNIKDQFFSIKENTKDLLYEMEDIIEHLNLILVERDPLKMVELCDELQSDVNWKGDMRFDASEIVYQEDYLSALNDYRERKELLLNSNYFDFYKKIASDMRIILEKPLIAYYKNDINAKNKWLKYTVKFSIVKSEIISSEVNEFTKEPEMVIEDNWKHYKLKNIYHNAKDEISVEYAINYYGLIRGDKMSPEKRAQEFLNHYFIDSLCDAFIEFIKDTS